MRVWFIFPCLFFSLGALAAPLEGINPRRIEIARVVDTVRVHGMGLPDLRAMISGVLDLEEQIGRRLSDDELARAAREQIAPYGSELDAEAAVCFAPNMRVLTPSGYRRICDLSPGNSVLSFDREHHRLTENTIRRVLRRRDARLGRFTGLAPLGRKIEATTSQAFFALHRRAGEKVTRVMPSSALLMIDESCTSLLRRGPFDLGVKESLAVGLQLDHEPKNYIVEKLLVE